MDRVDGSLGRSLKQVHDGGLYKRTRVLIPSGWVELVVSSRANPFVYVAPGWILLADPFGAYLYCDRLSDHTGYLKVEEFLAGIVLLDPVDGSLRWIP